MVPFWNRCPYCEYRVVWREGLGQCWNETGIDMQSWAAAVQARYAYSAQNQNQRLKVSREEFDDILKCCTSDVRVVEHDVNLVPVAKATKSF
jgi:hypothetical protein